MDDFQIEIQEEEREEPSKVQLPANFLLIGETAGDDICVYIHQDVYKALEKYALTDVEHERGTILLGTHCEALGKKNVIIAHYIEAKYTDASASTLTFTHKTWEYVHKEHDSQYPDEKIIGWQHTHPGYGIFLSNYDLFIHENFFNLPFQIAYVIDPVQNLRGFFQWKNGRIEKLKGYYIYDADKKPIKIQQEKPKKEEKTPTASKGLKTAVTILSLVVVFMLVQMFLLQNRYNTLYSHVREQEEKQEQQIEALQGKAQDAPETGERDEREVTYILHTVQQGETLEQICTGYGIDYYAVRSIVLGTNGLASPDKIYEGEKLLLPVKKNR